MDRSREPLFEKILRLLGAGLVSIFVLGLLVFLVYAFYEQFTERGRHWAAVGLTFGLFVAFGLGYAIGRAYRSGFADAHRDRASQAGVAPVITQSAPPAVYDATLDRLPATPRLMDADEAARFMTLLEDIDA